MKRKIIFIVAIMLILSMCTCIFTACPSNESSDKTQNNGTTNNVPSNGVKHYEVQLNKNNFKEFCEYKVTIQTTAAGYTPKKDFYEIIGVLSYAYYKDVYITFHAEYSNSDGLGGTIYYRGDYTIKLNAAGNYSFYTNDEALLKAINCDRYTNQTQKNLAITAVSGTVIFDI